MARNETTMVGSRLDKAAAHVDVLIVSADEAGVRSLLRAVEACGVTDVGIPPGPPMFRFSDHGEIRSVMTAAGFSDIAITDISYDWELAGGDDLLTAFSEAAVRAGQLLRLQNQESLVAIKAFVVEEANRYERDGVIRIPMGAVLASGRKPTATKESAG